MKLGGRRPIDEELAHHLEALVEQGLARGLTPGQAREEARRRFGDPDVYGARCAAVWKDGNGRQEREGMMASMRQDLGFALRTMFRTPGFTAVVVLTLALGIGANTAIFSVVHGVLMRPLGLSDPDRLAVVLESSPALGVESAPASVPMFTDWREGVPSAASLAGWQWYSFTLQDPAESVEITGVLASGNYFSTLGVRAELGRLFGPDDEVPGAVGSVVVIGHGLWTRRFGADPDVVGTVLTLDGQPVEVVGVMPATHVAPSPEADVWLVAGYDAATLTRPNYGVRAVRTVARLAPGATLESLSAEASAVAERAARDNPQSSQNWSAHAVPYRETLVGEVRTALWVAFGAVGLLLLIACVNIANLMLARSAARRREMAVRTALGAGRGRIARQLLTESVLLGLLGGAVGTLVALGVHQVILALEPGVLPRVQEIRLDLAVLGFALALSVLTGLAFGLAPALHASAVRVSAVLKQAGGRGATGGHDRFRRVLVMGQLALTLVLLAGAGLLGRTFLELRAVDLGFEPEGVVAARVFLDSERYPDSPDWHLYYTSVLDRMARLPGVVSAGASSSLPMDPVAVNFDLPFRTEARAGADDGEIPQADFRVVTPGYFRTLGVRLLSGRTLSPSDGPETPRVILINRAMAELHFPGENPVGRRIETVYEGWKPYRVVGVVADTRYYGPDAEPRAEMYVAEAQASFTSMTLVARTAGSAGPLVPAVRRVFQEVDPLQPPQSVFEVDDLVQASVAAERFYATLLGVFALVAMVLAAAGVYGVLSYWVSQRTQEIGVRLALGAGRGQVLGLIVRNGMGMALAGIALGGVGAVVATRLLSSMLFGVDALDPLTLGAVAAALALAALAACLAPGLRAGRMAPVLALRQD